MSGSANFTASVKTGLNVVVLVCLCRTHRPTPNTRTIHCWWRLKIYLATILAIMKEIKRAGYPYESTDTQILDLPLHHVERGGEQGLAVHVGDER